MQFAIAHPNCGFEATSHTPKPLGEMPERSIGNMRGDLPVWVIEYLNLFPISRALGYFQVIPILAHKTW